MKSDLEKPFSAAEVLSALKSMHPSKAPGPDGFHTVFYQKYWHIVGDQVLSLVLGVLNGDVPLQGVNETFISLIPKTKSPEHILEYRPISLCNIVYKLVSKALANSLKSILPFPG